MAVWRSTRRLEWGAVVAAAAAAVVLALPPAHWPFDATAPGRNPSLWQLLLADRLTLGFVRLTLVVASVFVIASIPALFAAGRWARTFGGSGISADDPAVDEAAVEIARLTERVEQLTAERDALLQEVAIRGSRAAEPQEETPS